MTLKDQVQIGAPASQVWGWMADPRHMMQWNPKLIGVQPVSRTPVGVGYQFKSVYSLNGRNRTEYSSLITEWEPMRKWVCRSDQPVGERVARQSVTVESFTLIENEKGTLVRQHVDIRDSGVPFLVQLLLMYINRFGTAVGQTHLSALKMLAEKGPCP